MGDRYTVWKIFGPHWMIHNKEAVKESLCDVEEEEARGLLHDPLPSQHRWWGHKCQLPFPADGSTSRAGGQASFQLQWEFGFGTMFKPSFLAPAQTSLLLLFLDHH